MQRGATEVVLGVENGKYPHGNSVVVRGADRSVIIDPSLSLWEMEPPQVDQVLLTHVHEDHVAGLARYLDTPVAAHERDVAHLASIDALLAMYGLPDEATDEFRTSLVDDFHFVGRPDATAFTDDEVFDLGGNTVTAIPTPGHTAGHTAFLIEPDGVLVIGDIDLTGFGPYYADAVSSLVQFEESMARIREIEAAWYVTFHHKAVIEGHGPFVEALDRFASAIDRRDVAMLEYLSEPHTVADMVAHRFLYRPHVELPWADSAEERTTRQHLERLVERGRVTDLGSDRYVAAS